MFAHFCAQVSLLCLLGHEEMRRANESSLYKIKYSSSCSQETDVLYDSLSVAVREFYNFRVPRNAYTAMNETAKFPFQTKLFARIVDALC